MTQARPPAPGTSSDASAGAPGASPGRRIAGEVLAQLWRTEVPKVVERHEAERLQVRRALGLIS